ncbi:hypothetical protein CMV30_04400 [Nibricoccus aquaticus]|uniref:Uncharacterized protein n=1 Tax=Nibricoccus aquaticus TaxID=2576891 RepID=A0A290Q429_9BACT|nr:hypothetical protein CMV30_04400 [Nibricoccus aquaticus]
MGGASGAGVVCSGTGASTAVVAASTAFATGIVNERCALSISGWMRPSTRFAFRLRASAPRCSVCTFVTK